MTTRYQRGIIRVRSGRVYGYWRGEPINGKRPLLSAYLGEQKRGMSKAAWRDALRPHIEDYYRSLGRGGVTSAVTLREFVAKVFLPAHESGWSRNTKIAWGPLLRKHILEPLGDRQLTSIVKADIISLLNKMRADGYAQYTMSKVRERLHSIFEEAIDNRILEWNPTTRAHATGGVRASETRPLSESEVRSLYTRLDGMARLCWRVLIGCGLRPGELAALRRNDVGAELRIDEAFERGQYGPTKNKRTRYIPLAASLAAELDDWLKEHPGEPTDPVFSDEWGRPLLPGWLHRLVVLPAREIIPGVTLRQARATTATLMQGDVKDIQDLLGHSTAAMTLKHYRKSIDARMVASVEDMDRRLVGERPKAKVIRFRRKVG